MTKQFIFILASALISFSANAAGTHPCGSLDSIGNMIGDSKSFESVKVAYVSTEEPAAAPDHLLVFVYDANFGNTCTAISLDDAGNGFASVDMKSLKSIGYDAQKGRLLSVKVMIPNFEDSQENKSETIKFRANALTGRVTLE